MCLDGEVGNDGLQVRTVRDHVFWHVATGSQCDEIEAKKLAPAAAEHRTDVVALPEYTPREAADYHSQAAMPCTCSILDMKANAVHFLEEAAAAHVYQLSHVHVPSPAAGREVLLENRLFVVVGC